MVFQTILLSMIAAATGTSSSLPPEPYELLPRAEEVALARSAGLAPWNEAATVYVLESRGYVKAVEGTNGFTCLVGRDHPGTLWPICFDAEGSRAIVPRILREVALRQRSKSDEEVERDTWLFGIATHACLDHLRRKTRWRAEAHIEAEKRSRADPQHFQGVRSMLARPETVFEIREHIAFCFSCVGRSLDPEAQAAILLREVFGLSGLEGAAILGISEPVFRHRLRLRSARAAMIDIYQGSCELVNKNGACWQCRGLRELAPEAQRGENLVSIEVDTGEARGVDLEVESLFDARLAIVREAPLEDGKTSAVHRSFFEDLTAAAETGPGPPLDSH